VRHTGSQLIGVTRHFSSGFFLFPLSGHYRESHRPKPCSRAHYTFSIIRFCVGGLFNPYIRANRSLNQGRILLKMKRRSVIGEGDVTRADERNEFNQDLFSATEWMVVITK